MPESTAQHKNVDLKSSSHQPSNLTSESPQASFDEQPQFSYAAHQIKAHAPRLTPSEVLQLQRTMGNHAVTQLLQRNTHPAKAAPHITGLHSPSLHIQRNSKAEIDNGTAPITVTGGQAATSLSIAGNSRKPLAIVRGTIPNGGGVRNIEIHVHLTANDPITIFSGVNVRDAGAGAGFAYWSADTVASKAWLTNALNTGIPNWHRRDTWTGAPGGNQIHWMPAPNAGWQFDLALRKVARRANANYRVTFDISKPNIKKTDSVEDIKEETAYNLKTLCGPEVRVSVVKGGKSSPKWEMALIYTNEQDANDQLESDIYEIRTRKPSAENFQHTPTNQWD